MNAKEFLELLDIKLLTVGNTPQIGDTLFFEMYLSTFGGKDRSSDTVEQGAFLGYENAKLPLLLNHDNNTKSQAGSFCGVEDEKGLKCKCAFLVTPENLHEAMMLVGGHLNKCSMSGRFHYQKNSEGGLYQDMQGRYIIKKVDLFEGSLVCCPDNMDAEINQESINVVILETETSENGKQVQTESENLVSAEQKQAIKRLEILQEFKNIKNNTKGN